MRKLKRTHGMIFAVVAASLSLGCLGFATYAIETNALDKSLAIQNTTERAVCYNFRTSTRYTSLDKALSEAYGNNLEDKIYVIPGLGFDVSMLESHTIESTDSLILPYDGENDLGMPLSSDLEDNTKKSSYIGFADNDTAKRKTRLAVSDNLTITVEGTLSVGGMTGSPGSPMGQASSSYCEIFLGENSKIDVEGTFNCYGYIKESSNDSSVIDLCNGAVLTTPVVFYDHSSGSTTTSISGNGVFPYNQFDIPQIRPKMIFRYGSKLVGRAHLWGSWIGHQTATANLIGTEKAFINMASETSRVEWAFQDTNETATSTALKNHQTKIDFYGDGSFGSLSVTMSSITIDSKDYYLPVPCGYTVTIHEGSNFTIPSTINGIKFMPGSVLKCESGTNLTLDSNVLFYQNTTATDGTTFSYISSEAAIFESNGVVQINEGFEGVITTSSSKGGESQITLGWNYGPVEDSKQGTSASVFNWGGAYSRLKVGETISDKSSLSAGGIYSSDASCDYYEKAGELDPVDIESVTIGADSTASDVEKAGEFHLEPVFRPRNYGSSDVTYLWEIEEQKAGASFSQAETVTSLTKANATLYTEANTTEADIIYTIKLTVTFKSVDVEKTDAVVLTDSIDITAKYDSGCFAGDTEILMADGSIKQAKDIKKNDLVSTLDHDTGKLSYSKVAYVYSRPEHETNMLLLSFSDGATLKLVDDGHCLFDVDENRYVELDTTSIGLFVGHHFYRLKSDGTKSIVKLTSYSIKRTIEAAYSILTAKDINCFANGLLNVSDNIQGLYNYFDLDENMKIDKAKKESDINKYGLSKYEEWSDYCLKEEFEAFNGQYLNVSIGKGLTTKERLQKMMLMYSGKSAS